MGTKQKQTEGKVVKATKTAGAPPKRKVAMQAPTAAKRTATASKKAAPRKEITDALIALRAYFISEQRTAAGAPGDPLSDWVEAERQLLAEQ